MVYYPPGRGLLIIAGLMHIVFSMGTFGVSITQITAISYSDIPLLGLPETLPNISWIGHYFLAMVVGAGNFVLGILAVKYRQRADMAKFLLVISLAGIIIYAAFVIFSGYDEAYYMASLWTIPFGFGVPILYISGAGLNYIAQLKHDRKAKII